MEWYEIFALLLGALGGTGGMISLYTAKAKRTSMEVDSFLKMFNEAQDERDKIKEMYSEYEEKTNEKMRILEDKLKKVESKNNKLMTAIFTAYKCPNVSKVNDCPVIHRMGMEAEGNNIK